MTRATAAAAGVLALAVVGVRGCRPPTTVATFNIEQFPKSKTDRHRVAARIAEADADLLAVQEIVDGAALREVAAWASAATERDYRVLLSECAEQSRFASPGFLYDADRLPLVAHEDFPELSPDGRGKCALDSLPGVLAVFEDGTGQRIAALSVHHRAFPANFEKRKTQLGNTLQIFAEAERKYDAHVIALGDFNTTGFVGEPARERAHFDKAIGAAGLRLTTGNLTCTEYYKPRGETTYLPSLLDHILLRDGDWDDAEVLGMCAALSCRPVDGEMPEDYTVVSDHCPVRVRGRW